MTFADYCILCGGPVEVYDEYTAKCWGWCGQRQERIEDMSDAQRARNFRVVQRALAIANAKDVEVKGDVL